MALKDTIRDRVIKMLAIHEGRVNSFYLDSLGYVTIGVGYLVSNRSEVAPLTMYKALPGGTLSIIPATLQEKQAEYDRFQKLPKGYKAAWYNQQASLFMAEADIDALLEQTVNGFYPQLARIYTIGNGYKAEFDAFPDDVQVALFDMVYTLGAFGLTNKFVKFNQAIKAADWTTAAMESNRPQLMQTRNQNIKDLFTAAAKAAKPIK